MSITLDSANVSGLAVGQSGFIDMSNVAGQGGIPYQANPWPTIRLHNDSGAGLQINLPKSGESFNLPAGGWVDCFPDPGETQIGYTVVYLLPNPPVSLLMATYYYPGEQVPAMTSLGNSPVGIGGSVQTSMGWSNTLQNDNNAANTQFIEATQTGSPGSNVYCDNSGNFYIAEWLNGILTKILQVLPGQGNDVLLGKLNATVEALGQFIVAQNLLAQADLYVTNGPGGANGVELSYANGINLLNGKLNLLSGSLSRIAQFGSYAIGTTYAYYNHNLGAVPDLILLVGVSDVSATFIYDDLTLTSTQVQIMSSVGGAYCRGLALKF